MESHTVSAVETPMAGVLRALVTRIAAMMHRMVGRGESRLHLCETISLGNRGYLAVVRYNEQQFLIGGTHNSIALLAPLGNMERQATDELSTNVSKR
jgi:flagellar biogenesis protein FliO